jgi:hypothetical protein
MGMKVRLALASGTTAFALWAPPAHAGPCENQIYQVVVAIGQRLDAAAAKGKAESESTFATTHRQPTPRTLAAAEEKAGDLSESEVKAVRQLMEEARAADAAGDLPACEKALAEVRTIGR